MVQKFCPQCKDWIPVACKTCPCGHKFIKAANKDQSKFELEALSTANSRKENGRPRRASAMNSLYYHSALHVSSYKLAKQAAVVNVRKRRRRDNDDVDTSQSKNGRGSETVVKKRKGRPPRIAKMAANLGSKHPEIAPNLRNRMTNELTDHSNSSSHATDSESKSKTSRTVSESESYNRLYKGLSNAQKQHFATILAEINKKFYRNTNFPL